MKDLDALLKAVADGLNAMAEGIHSIAKKVDELAKGQAPRNQPKPNLQPKRKQLLPRGRHQRKPNMWAQRLRLPLIRSLRSSRDQVAEWITKPS